MRGYDVVSGETRWVQETDGAEVTGVAFRAERPSVLVLDRGGVGLWRRRLKVWRLRSPSRPIGTVTLPPEDGVKALALSPDGRTLTIDATRGRRALQTRRRLDVVADCRRIRSR